MGLEDSRVRSSPWEGLIPVAVVCLRPGRGRGLLWTYKVSKQQQGLPDIR